MSAPTSVRFSPDGRLVTYLFSDDESLVRQLWAYDPSSELSRAIVRAEGQGDTDASVSSDEALRRERQRVRGFGVTSYAWADEAPVLLIPLLGKLLISDDDGGHLRPIETNGEAIDPRLNPSGTAVAYVQSGEIWVCETSVGAVPRQLTVDAAPPSASGERLITNGLAEFIAQEEMARSSGLWWSRDGSQIAFVQVDTSEIPAFTITHDADDPPSTETHRYPFAGSANATVRLGIVNLAESTVIWVPLGEEQDIYLARVDWSPNGELLLQVESRDQRRLELLRFDPATQSSRVLRSERLETWINLHDDLRLLPVSAAEPKGYRILWSSERSGFRHLYLLNRDGAEIRQLTAGDWPVDRVVDVRGAWVYFLAGVDSPLERHVWRVNTDDGRIERLSAEPGMHTAAVSPSGEYFADLWDSCTQAPSLVLRASTGETIRVIHESEDSEARRLGLAAPEFLQLTADDGTTLHTALYPPANVNGRPCPLIVSVYGGPHVQQVSNSWGMTVDLRAQYLARQGYAVLKVDNRGSSRRGHVFEAAVCRNLGDLEVQDQVAAVRAVTQRPGLDGSRVGIYGWSYGGYMAIMCLLRAPDVFRVAVAGAPVTDWGGYDTHYTERYMGTPQENVAGYRRSSALEHAGSLLGELLVIHGMIDENVHFRHTVRLLDAATEAGKTLQLLPFPHERHMPRREEDRAFMESRMIDHFRRFL